MRTRRPRAGMIGTIPRPVYAAQMAADWDLAGGRVMVLPQTYRRSALLTVRFLPPAEQTRRYQIHAGSFTLEVRATIECIEEPPGIKVSS